MTTRPKGKPIELLRNRASGEYWFRIRARNGKVLVHSEMYKTKKSAKNGIEALAEMMGRHREIASALTDDMSND